MLLEACCDRQSTSFLCCERGAYPDIDKDGIFAKDQELKEFLVSGPAILAALQLQHAFESEHNQQDCVGLEICAMHICASPNFLTHINPAGLPAND